MKKARWRRETTEFEHRVYDAVKVIPAGRVATYRDIALRVGCRCARAVGQALRRNPYAPGVPCHRVIASDLSPGGYQGRTQGGTLRRKLRLLEQEGVRFAEGRLADPERVFMHPDNGAGKNPGGGRRGRAHDVEGK